MGTLAIANIGILVSGDLAKPVLTADTILIEDGRIAAIGGAELVAGADSTIDAQDTTVMPGLIDSHVHPVFGDYTPRQKQQDFIDSCLHGGVTTMISAGEAHFPGRPKTPAGAKALALLGYLSSRNARPAGVKLHGGALILEKGLTEADFADLAAEGCWLVGEVGLGTVHDPVEAAPMVEWAHKHGFKVLMHTGGTSIPGSTTVSAVDVATVKPDVVCHLNGGPTSVSPDQIEHVITDTDLNVEIVQCGNFKTAAQAARLLKERGELGRLVLGNDAPSGTGVIPLGILRNIAFLASMADVDPADAICCATGTTARVFGLDTGIIEVGKAADLVICDAPMGSAGADALEALAYGDLPGISAVLIDGVVRAKVSRNTPPATRKATV